MHGKQNVKARRIKRYKLVILERISMDIPKLNRCIVNSLGQGMINVMFMSMYTILRPKKPSDKCSYKLIIFDIDLKTMKDKQHSPVNKSCLATPIGIKI